MNTGYRNLVDWAARSSAGLSCILRPFRNHIRELEPDPDAIEFGFETVFLCFAPLLCYKQCFFFCVCFGNERGMGIWVVAERC